MTKFLFNQNLNPVALVFLRVSTALVLVLSFCAIWADFAQLYGSNGLVDPEILKIKQSQTFLHITEIQRQAQQLIQISAVPFHTSIFILYLSLCFFLMIGFLSRITSFLLLLFHAAIFISVPQFTYGFDYFCKIALFYCLLFPVGHYNSIDNLLFKLKPSRWANPCIRILQLHVCLIYFFSGFDKILGHTWRNGEALWKTMQLPYFINDNFAVVITELGAYPWVWLVAGWALVFIELLYPVLVWIPKTRKIIVWVVIILHLQIALFLQLYYFSAIMIVFNVAAFYEDFLYPFKSQHSIKPKSACVPCKNVNSLHLSASAQYKRKEINE